MSVTIPSAVKRGDNALLICNYDIENDTLYTVKWYRGRREFYRYTPKENPAGKIFKGVTGTAAHGEPLPPSTAVSINIDVGFTQHFSSLPFGLMHYFISENPFSIEDFQQYAIAVENQLIEKDTDNDCRANSWQWDW